MSTAASGSVTAPPPTTMDVISSLNTFLLFAGRREHRLGRAQRPSSPPPSVVHVGALLDLGSPGWKASRAAMSLALEDFHASQPGSAVKVKLHIVDCKDDEVTAASAAIDLLKDIKVQAIIGPETSTQARFIIDLGNKTNVPILSYSATSPYLSAKQSKYFVRTALDDASQVPAIAALVQHFSWRQVVPIHEDTDFGRGIIPYLEDALLGVDAHIPYQSVMPSVPTDDQINAELNKLMTMQTRVFVVHMSPKTAARLFVLAHGAGMLVDGYAWIVTDSVGNIFSTLSQNTISSMQGVLGVRPYVPPSEKLQNFHGRFVSQYQQQNPGAPDPGNPIVFQLWAYDTAWAIAMALSKVGPRTLGFQMPSSQNSKSSNDLTMLGVSRDGPGLIDAIRATRFQGMSGEFVLVDGQRQASAFEIFNVIGNSYQTVGFWIPKSGLSKNLIISSGARGIDGLNKVIWPGSSIQPPRGWEWPVAGKKLQIAVPVKVTNKFVNVEKNVATGTLDVTGYSIDIFEAVMQEMPYAVLYEYVPVEISGMATSMTMSYSEICRQVSQKKYDAMVGDTTIIVNRSLYVDFTLPYTESGVQMVVPVKENWSKSLWIFLKPIEPILWVAILAVFVFTGFVIWLVEHKDSRYFGGSAGKQLVNLAYFNFQALISVPKDPKVKKWLSKFALINWLLLAWLLEKLYSASLTSMMTVRQLQPTAVDLNQLISNGDYIGYQSGSFVRDLLKSLRVDEQKLRNYSSPEQYAEGLMKGTRNGGVAAMFDEIPYLKVFMSKYCRNHTVVGRVYKTGGFGFVFPKGSPLVADVSRAILKVTEGDQIVGIEQKWFGDEVACNSQVNVIELGSVITWNSLRGVFFITIGLWAAVAFIYALIWFFRRGRRGEQVQQAVAELAIERVHGDPSENIIWRIDGDSCLLIRLHGNPAARPLLSPEQEAKPEAEPATTNGGDSTLEDETEGEPTTTTTSPAGEVELSLHRADSHNHETGGHQEQRN